MQNRVGATRLGFAECTPANDASFAQWVFLQTVARLFPDCLKELKVAERVDDWATTWRLDAPWIRAHAESSRRMWMVYPHASLSWMMVWKGGV